MRFEPNEDQTVFFTALDQIMGGKEAAWKVSPDWSRFDWAADLDALLEQNGFYECAAEATLGPTAAVAMIFRLATLPVAVECAASTMLRPRFAPHLPRPLAVIEGQEKSAVRFLSVAKSVLALERDRIRVAVLHPGSVEPVESIFAYPMARLVHDALEWRAVDADPEAVRNAWRIGVAVELAGVVQGGLDAVVAHVRERRQFGRPLGSFQAIQHRLASAATKIQGAYWLALRAAQHASSTNAALALGYVQEASTAIIYDLHQFMGAMGVTLEHPLHRWTYRARLLRSSLGGAGANLRLVAAEMGVDAATGRP